MNRRNFIGLLGRHWGGECSPCTDSRISAYSSHRKLEPSTNEYFEFSLTGMECLVKRYDTPVSWLNLLSNERMVVWAAHDGTIVESCLINNSSNRLTNPHSGYLYVRDSETGQHLILNRPLQNSAWNAAQGLDYIHVTQSAQDLTVTATCFVPRYAGTRGENRFAKVGKST